MNKSDMKYFSKAAQVASISDFKQVHFGCVAVYKSTIIGAGFNTNKTHPIQKYYNRFREEPGNAHFSPKLHAEINCLNQIRNLDIDFSKVKLYIYRARNDRDFSLSRPCKSCMQAIKDLHIRDIYYTSDESYVHERIRYRKAV